MTEVTVIEGLLDEYVDSRSAKFAERAIEMGQPVDSRWQVMECLICGCGCRRYNRLP